MSPLVICPVSPPTSLQMKQWWVCVWVSVWVSVPKRQIPDKLMLPLISSLKKCPRWLLQCCSWQQRRRSIVF